MFNQSAKYYDKIYAFKDYGTESETLMAAIQAHKRAEGTRLLDVACGTGKHLTYLKAHFAVEGLDLDPELLDIARAQHPEVPFHHGDMLDFTLDHSFEVVTCLFSSIGYVKTVGNLRQAIACMARHLVPGGVLVVEPWFPPEAWHPGTVHALFIDEPELKIARVNTSFVDGRHSYFDLHYLIGTPEGTEHFVERHELGLFTQEEMREAFMDAGLAVVYDDEGLMGRGLYVGTSNPSP